MERNSRKKIDYQEYRRRGGMLSRKSILHAQQESAPGGSRRGSCDRSLHRAEEMSKFSGVETSPAQNDLYAVLRVMTSPQSALERKRALSQAEYKEPWQLTDQKLKLEVLKLTGDSEDCREFEEAYPNIFGDGEE